ncbi:hypothetical protein FJT64_016000 [Amphibalanus amphitrite]|uniref:Uncharacterized protein n=1 Tax=Amphibalanus amphitrite TaxID=1232801 RepID=A0A6A4X2G2_AMPAM|nr:hypothetical protein FJT64_016000 [Amphibalanus amphitrite]
MGKVRISLIHIMCNICRIIGFVMVTLLCLGLLGLVVPVLFKLSGLEPQMEIVVNATRGLRAELEKQHQQIQRIAAESARLETLMNHINTTARALQRVEAALTLG